MKKKLVVFSGAGLDEASGIETFRNIKNGLWYNYNVDEVATLKGWRKNPKQVLEFHNMLRSKLPDVKPNEAHLLLTSLEENYDVIHVTQNVSDLLERGGATNVIHLHGELTKGRGSNFGNKPIGYNDINIGDKCPLTGSQLRPSTVLFDEYPFRVSEAYKAIYEADILLIVGTSLQISYTIDMLNNVRQVPTPCKIFYIDPFPKKTLDSYKLNVNYVEKTAIEGITEVINILNDECN